MRNRQRVLSWSAAAVSFVVGLIFVLNDSAAGWIFFIFGLSYVGASTRTGQTWTASNPGLARWGLIGMTMLLVLLIAITGAVFLLK